MIKSGKILEACCAQLTQHVAAASVAYNPGVDVDSKKAASVDSGGSLRIEPLKNQYTHQC